MAFKILKCSSAAPVVVNEKPELCPVPTKRMFLKNQFLMLFLGCS